MPIAAPYTSNKTSNVQDATVGLKISKPGYDATRTAGSNLIFSSSWPSLPIAFETFRTGINVGIGATLAIAHNLKFAPFTMMWATSTDPKTGTLATQRYFPMSDVNNIYIRGSFVATNLLIRCFQVDLARDIDYKLAPGDTFNMPYDPDYGVKVVKQFKDINSTDLRDFALHSKAQSPLILAVKTQDTMPAANINIGGLNYIQYVSKLTYPVWVYGYIKVGTTLATNLGVPINTFRIAPYYSAAYPKTTTDGFVAYLGYTNPGVNADNGATLVILRDPMFAATQTTVTF